MLKVPSFIEGFLPKGNAVRSESNAFTYHEVRRKRSLSNDIMNFEM